MHLLQTLGATTKNIQRMFLIEFTILGMLSGGLGIIGALGLTGVLQKYGLRLEPQFEFIHIITWFVAIVILTVISGFWVQRNTVHTKKAT